MRFALTTAIFWKMTPFFEEDALRCLNLAKSSAVAAVAPFDSSMQVSAVVLSENGWNSAFRMRQTAADLDANGPRLLDTLNILRLDSVTLRGIIVPALDEIVGSGARQAYTEELLAYLIERRGLTSPRRVVTIFASVRSTARRICETLNACSPRLSSASSLNIRLFDKGGSNGSPTHRSCERH